MAKYRIKLREVEAITVQDAILMAGKNWAALPSWLKDAYETGNVLFGRKSLFLKTDLGITNREGAQSCDMLYFDEGKVHIVDRATFFQVFEPIP